MTNNRAYFARFLTFAQISAVVGSIGSVGLILVLGASSYYKPLFFHRVLIEKHLFYCEIDEQKANLVFCRVSNSRGLAKEVESYYKRDHKLSFIGNASVYFQWRKRYLLAVEDGWSRVSLADSQNLNNNYSIELTFLAFPLWMPAIVLLPYPLFRVYRVYWIPGRRFLRFMHNKCLSCEYVLYSNNSGICPECGTLISREQRARLGLATSADSGISSGTCESPAAGDSPPPIG